MGGECVDARLRVPSIHASRAHSMGRRLECARNVEEIAAQPGSAVTARQPATARERPALATGAHLPTLALWLSTALRHSGSKVVLAQTSVGTN